MFILDTSGRQKVAVRHLSACFLNDYLCHLQRWLAVEVAQVGNIGLIAPKKSGQVLVGEFIFFAVVCEFHDLSIPNICLAVNGYLSV